MPGLLDWLLNRNRQPEAPPVQTPADTTVADPNAATREAVRGMPYDQAAETLRPDRAPLPAAPEAAAPTAAGPGLAAKGEPRTIELPKGREYALTPADIQGDSDATWQHVAEQNGTIAWRLQQANPGVTELTAGTKLYLPSAEEQLYADCLRLTGSEAKAAEKYGEVAAAGGLAVVKGARSAASGDSGESYGTAGKGGAFYASNPNLAGASSKRTVQQDGKTLYKIVWASNFWKCNLFANESVYRGGFEPSMQANKHYTTAGSLHTDTKTFQEVPATAAYAGLVTVFQSGGGSNESHTGVLGSMPLVETDADGNTVLTFTFIGASSDRAKEADKHITLKKGTNEILSGDSHEHLRFLKPLKKRPGA